jgi:DNA-binding MarR family transcriptional regulator
MAEEFSQGDAPDFGANARQPHSATSLVRELIEKSTEFNAFMETALSVNETDFRAMGALMENGAMTAGQLAKAVGVSPGAATSIIDRLVAVGHVTREQNAADRRGVLVVPNPNSVKSAWGHLAPIIATSESTIRGMDEASQRAVVAFLESMIAAFTTAQQPR